MDWIASALIGALIATVLTYICWKLFNLRIDWKKALGFLLAIALLTIPLTILIHGLAAKNCAPQSIERHKADPDCIYKGTCPCAQR
jgi:hypothetical protein